jgi:predicted phosphate transport protein (TIGR00153 family)
MKLDAVIHALLPKDTQFFQYFEADVENLLKAATVLKELMSPSISRTEREQKIRKVEELEHRGDDVTHEIFSYLSSTFVTPFDREDIHALASTLDDILDYLKGTATRISLYKVDEITADEEKLAGFIHQAVTELHTAVLSLRDLRSASTIRESLVRIHSIENEADDLFERAIGNLFDTCTDPIRLIKTKEILVSLETATDQCEDAANVIETIMVKNA